MRPVQKRGAEDTPLEVVKDFVNGLPKILAGAGGSKAARWPVTSHERGKHASERGKLVAGGAYWLSGSSGTGKTTIARLLAAELADEIHIKELNASDLTPARLREIETAMQFRGWGKAG